MDLETRVRRLERENRILRYGGLLVVAVVLTSEAAVAQRLEGITELSVFVDVEETDIVDESSVRNRVEVVFRRNGIRVDASVLPGFGISVSTLTPTSTLVAGLIQVWLLRSAFVRTDSRWNSLDFDSLSSDSIIYQNDPATMWTLLMLKLIGFMEPVPVWSDERLFTSQTTNARNTIFDAIDRLMDSFVNDYLKENQRSP